MFTIDEKPSEESFVSLLPNLLSRRDFNGITLSKQDIPLFSIKPKGYKAPSNGLLSFNGCRARSGNRPKTLNFSMLPDAKKSLNSCVKVQRLN